MQSIRRRPVLALVLICGLVAAVPGHAADPLDPLVDSAPFALPADDLLALVEKVAETDPPPDGAAVDLLLLEIRHDVGDDGRTVSERREVYRLLTPAALEGWASVEAAWTAWFQERPELTARVVTPDGREVRLDPTTVVDGTADPGSGLVYSDQRLARAPLPALRAGAVVETSVRVVDTRPMLAEGGVARRVRLYGLEPVRRARLTVEGPAAESLRWRSVGGVGEPRREELPGRVRLTFDLADLAAWEYVSGRPPEVPLGPTVDFSFDASWNGVARAYAEVVEAQLADLPPDAPLLDGVGDSQWQTIAARLADLHRRLRYTSVALGDSGIVPRTPTETLERGYGDCKDLSLLLVASLRRQGVPAYLALLRAASGSDDVHPEVPGFGLFDHAIVYVPGREALWIDPTDPAVGVGDLAPGLEGRWALVVTPETTAPIRIPEDDSSPDRLVETRRLLVPQHGLGRVVETSRADGHLERQLRRSWGSDADRAEVDLGEYALLNYVAERVVSSEIDGLEDATSPLVARVEVAGSAMVESDADGARLFPGPGELFYQLPLAMLVDPATDGSQRQVDFRLDRQRVEHRYRIPVPEGFEVVALPDCPPRELGPAVLDCAVSETDGTVRIDLAFDTVQERYTPAELAEFRRLRQTLDESSLEVVLERTAARLAREGDVAGALAEHDRMARREPREAAHPALASAVLLSVGLRDAAVERARRATRVDPESSFAWYQLGTALLHDPVGRPLAPGFDRPGAVAALEKARQLAPDDPRTLASLGLVLAIGPDGLRPATGDDLDAALAVYRQLEPLTFDDRIAREIARRQLRDSRLDALLTELAADPGTDALWGFYLAARCLADGCEAATTEAARRLAGKPARLEAALALASAELVRLRRYEPAAEILRAAVDPDAGVSELSLRLDILEQTAVPAATPPPADRPEELAVWLLARAYAVDSEDEMATFLTEALVAHARRAETGLLDLVSQALGVHSHEPAMLGTFVADNFVSGLEVEGASGEAGVGSRVDVVSRAPFAEGEVVSVYLASRPTGWRIAAVGDTAGLVADEGMRRLAAGDLAAARWWGREELAGLALAEYEERGTAELVARLDDRLSNAAGTDLRQTLELLRALGRRAAEDVAVVRRAADSTDSADVRHYLSRTLVFFQGIHRQPAAALATLDAMTPQGEEERSQDLYQRSHILLELDRPQDVVDLMDTALETTTDEWDRSRWRLLRALALLALDRPGEARAELVRLAAEPETSTERYNTLAWVALLAGQVDETSIGWAETAVEERFLDEDDHRFSTLASLYAASGQPLRAHETLSRSFPQMGSRVELTPGGWWIYGRIAEELGLDDVARGHYLRAIDQESPEEASSPASVVHLARRSLERLAAGGTTPGDG